jgi:hypothetical protein
MAYEKKDGDITLFINDKGGNEKRPDYKGAALIGGVEYSVSIWHKQSKNGTSYLSGTIQKMEKKTEKKEEPQKPNETKPLDDDVIPF